MTSEYRYWSNRELVHSFDMCGEYIYDRDTEICRRAGMEEEWMYGADDETFEGVLDRAVSILKDSAEEEGVETEANLFYVQTDDCDVIIVKTPGAECYWYIADDDQAFDELLEFPTAAERLEAIEDWSSWDTTFDYDEWSFCTSAIHGYGGNHAVVVAERKVPMYGENA